MNENNKTTLRVQFTVHVKTAFRQGFNDFHRSEYFIYFSITYYRIK